MRADIASVDSEFQQMTWEWRGVESVPDVLRLRTWMKMSAVAARYGVSRQAIHKAICKYEGQQKEGGRVSTTIAAPDTTTPEDREKPVCSTEDATPASPTQQPEEASMNNQAEGRSTWIRTS